MFIPTWVLVVVGIWLLFTFGRELVRELAGLALILALILALPAAAISYWFAMLYWKQHDYTLALIVGSPCLALCAWGMWHSLLDERDNKGRLNVGALDLRLGLHHMGTVVLSKPTAVMNSRLAFARQIHLGQHLYRFYDAVEHFPRWYASKTEPWNNKVIPKETIARVKLEKLSTYGIKSPEHTSAHDALVFKFSASNREYIFCVHDDAAPMIDYAEDEPGWRFDAIRVYVVELPRHIVLEDEIVYRSGMDADVYHSDDIEAFLPGRWITELLKTADALEAETETDLARSSKQWEAERAKRFVTAKGQDAEQ